jgi:predicted RNA-binding protein with PUA-like domain
MMIAREGYPDRTAFNADSKHFDPKRDSTKPRWFMVDVRYERCLKRIIGLAELKGRPELQDMPLVRGGNCLSITSVTKQQWDFILALEE